MKIIKIISILIITFYFIFYMVLPKGDAKKGKILFNDPSFSGGITGNSCASCHPDGKGLEGDALKKKKILEKAINKCIVNELKGHAIDPKSEEMKDLIAYIKSLRKKTSQ